MKLRKMLIKSVYLFQKIICSCVNKLVSAFSGFVFHFLYPTTYERNRCVWDICATLYLYHRSCCNKDSTSQATMRVCVEQNDIYLESTSQYMLGRITRQPILLNLLKEAGIHELVDNWSSKMKIGESLDSTGQIYVTWAVDRVCASRLKAFYYEYEWRMSLVTFLFFAVWIFFSSFTEINFYLSNYSKEEKLWNKT